MTTAVKRPEGSRAARRTAWTTSSSPTVAPTANENAIRMARLTPVGTRCSRSTGRTTATRPPPSWRPAIRAAGRTTSASPDTRTLRPVPVSIPFWSKTPEEETERALATSPGHRARGAGHHRGHPAGVGGRHRRVLVPPAGYLAGVRALCDVRHPAASPTRSWSASAGRASGSPVDHSRGGPDLITFAKGVNSGYVPARRCHPQRRGVRLLPRAGLSGWPHLLGSSPRLRRRGGDTRRHGR